MLSYQYGKLFDEFLKHTRQISDSALLDNISYFYDNVILSEINIPDNPSISVDQQVIYADYKPQDVVITINTLNDWEIQNIPDNISLSQLNGSGYTNLIISFKQNDTESTIENSFIIYDVFTGNQINIYLIQDYFHTQYQYFLEVKTDDIQVDYREGNGNLQVNSYKIALDEFGNLTNVIVQVPFEVTLKWDETWINVDGINYVYERNNSEYKRYAYFKIIQDDSLFSEEVKLIQKENRQINKYVFEFNPDLEEINDIGEGQIIKITITSTKTIIDNEQSSEVPLDYQVQYLEGADESWIRYSKEDNSIILDTNVSNIERNGLLRFVQDETGYTKNISVHQGGIAWNYIFNIENADITRIFNTLGGMETIVVTSTRQRINSEGELFGDIEQVEFRAVPNSNTFKVNNTGNIIQALENKDNYLKTGTISYYQNNSNKQIDIHCEQSAGSHEYFYENANFIEDLKQIPIGGKTINLGFEWYVMINGHERKNLNYGIRFLYNNLSTSLSGKTLTVRPNRENVAQEDLMTITLYDYYNNTDSKNYIITQNGINIYFSSGTDINVNDASNNISNTLNIKYTKISRSSSSVITADATSIVSCTVTKKDFIENVDTTWNNSNNHYAVSIQIGENNTTSVENRRTDIKFTVTVSEDGKNVYYYKYIYITQKSAYRRMRIQGSYDHSKRYWLARIPFYCDNSSDILNTFDDIRYYNNKQEKYMSLNDQTDFIPTDSYTNGNLYGLYINEGDSNDDDTNYQLDVYFKIKRNIMEECNSHEGGIDFSYYCSFFNFGAEGYVDYASIIEIDEDFFDWCKSEQGIWRLFFMKDSYGLNWHGYSCFEYMENVSNFIPKYESNFTGMFYDCSKLQNTPVTEEGYELWERAGKEGYPATIEGDSCFYNCLRLPNYNEIPSNWKNKIQ